MSPLIDTTDPPRAGETAVSGIGKCHSTGRDHATLAHAEGANDGQSEDGKRGLLRHYLKEICSPWLAEIGVYDAGNVNDCVRDNQLEEPAKRAADPGG